MFYCRFVDECKKIGKKPTPVAKEIGIASGTVSGWKNGALPKQEALEKIATYFGCTTDYLLGRSESRTSHGEYEVVEIRQPLTEQEEIILSIFRNASAEGRMEIIATAMTVKKTTEKNSASETTSRVG